MIQTIKTNALMETNKETFDITVFTDPLCCWSWAFESQLQQLKNTLGAEATWTYKMGGLIPSWDNFHDTVNAVTRPVQMGPVWMHAGQIAQRPISHQLWMTDPPVSSYPACVAVKCAQLQNESAGEAMLNLLREACMTAGKNIAKQEVLFEVADKLAFIMPGFDLKLFKQDFFGEGGMSALRADLDEVSYYRINRFPTLVIKSRDSNAILFSGYRNYKEILQAIERIKNPEQEA